MSIDIRALEAQIAEVDDRLAELFETRMTLAAQIAVHLDAEGESLDDAQREQETIARLQSRINGPVSSYLPLLYETVFDLSRDYQAFVLED